MAAKNPKREKVGPKADKRTDDEKLLETARKRFERAVEAYGQTRNLQREDIKFLNASSDNDWQWPTDQLKSRADDGRPRLTVNKLPLHQAQVTNDARQNRPAIKIRPFDGGADPETAEVFNGIIRGIEANSDSDTAYDMGVEESTAHGEGYIYLVTEYGDQSSFDQDIYIKPVDDPFAYYPDPDCVTPEASDAAWWFVETWFSKEEYEQRWPGKGAQDWDFAESNASWSGWFSEGKVRVAAYWHRQEVPQTLYLWADGTTSTEPREPDETGVAEKPVRTREVIGSSIYRCLLSPMAVLERQPWAGSYFPIVRVAGRIKKIDGKYVISGLVRNAKSAQQLYNYWCSQEAEFLGKWNKIPYIGPDAAFEGFENKWAAANRSDAAYLPYNAYDDENRPIAPPQRVQPPTTSSGILQAKMGAADDIKSTTGQFDASLGQKSNETSGRAIIARQREGDTATYHYVDNLNKAIRQIGRILVDLIPKIYDAPRVARILGEDGESSAVRIDPDLKQASAQQKGPDGGIERIYNLSVGRYDVTATVGPSFTTKRQEALEAMTTLVQGNGQLWQVIGDLLVKNMDWPGAEDMAKRLKAILLPQVQQMEDAEQALPPQVQAQLEQMQQTIEQLTAALEDSMDSADRAKAEALKSNAEAEQDKVALQAWQTEIKAYEAETDRAAKLGAISPELASFVQQTLLQTLTSLETSTDIDPGNGASFHGGGDEGFGAPESLPAVDPADEMPLEPSMAMEVAEPEQIEIDPRQLQLMPPPGDMPAPDEGLPA